MREMNASFFFICEIFFEVEKAIFIRLHELFSLAERIMRFNSSLVCQLPPIKGVA